MVVNGLLMAIPRLPGYMGGLVITALPQLEVPPIIIPLVVGLIVGCILGLLLSHFGSHIIKDGLFKRDQVQTERERLFNLSMDMLCVAGFDGYFEELSPAWEETLGWSKEELLSRPWLELVHPDDLEATIQAGDQLLAGRAVWGFQNRYLCKAGDYRWVSWNSYPLPDEKKIFAVVRDVTAQKQSEESLRSSQEQLELIIDNIPALIGYIDAEQRFLYVNQAYADWYGFKKEEVVGKYFKDVLYPESYQVALPMIEAVLRGEEFAFENVSYDTAGHLRAVRAMYVPHFDETGKVKAFFGLVHDITDRKQVEEELRRAKEVAESANLAKSAFLANMSHELRTPLNAILGFSELMRSAPNLTLEQYNNLSIIMRSGEHLLDLINDVLELSKIESGRQELQPQSFDLYDMLQRLQEMFQLRIQEKAVTLIFARDVDVPHYISTEEHKLRQVLINLLSNAIKFTDTGSITLQISVVAGSPDERQDAESKSRLYFKVTDTGVGIAPDEIDKVFDAFVQTESGRQLKSGTGLGMPISRQYVRMMGGELTVESVLGQGSTFSFDIEIGVVSASDMQALDVTAYVFGLEPGQERYRLLVVEDDEYNRELLVSFLEPLGFEIREATNGQEAIEIWEEWQPALIFMDIRMPVLDGQEATKRIKTTPQGQKTIIVALTASAFEEERTEALVMGCDDFVRKPYREKEILDVLVKHLNVRFIYEDFPASRTAQPLTPRVTGDEAVAIPAVPEVLRKALAQAALDADVTRIGQLINEFRAFDELLADLLQALAYDFDYNQILELMDIN
ncbi:MAG: PAS domain S-box protein [Anaerolineae bacterium]|nr:PAS domain S-box protein [Anaerolineae bacterium]